MPALIAEWREKIARETTVRRTVRALATVHRKLAALSVAFTAAENESQWVESNPNVKEKKSSRYCYKHAPTALVVDQKKKILGELDKQILGQSKPGPIEFLIT